MKGGGGGEGEGRVINRMFIFCFNILQSSENRIVDACEKHGWKFTSKTHSCYKFMGTSETWSGALNKCWLKGGLLVTVGSLVENKVVYDMAPANNKKTGRGADLWLGYRLSNSYQWIWVDGKKNPYTNWDKGQPDNKGGSQSCAHMWGWYNTDKWDDLECTETKQFVCKTPVHGKFIKLVAVVNL